jgi:hypothetical protein
VKTHNLVLVQGKQCTDCGTKTIGSLWDNHEFVPFELSLQPTLGKPPQTSEKAAGVRNTYDVDRLFFCRSPRGTALLGAAWALVVAPSGMPHRGPDTSSRDMRLVAASEEAAGSMGVEPLAVDLCDPLGCCRLATPAATVAYANPPSVGPSCRLLCPAWSPVVP